LWELLRDPQAGATGRTIVATGIAAGGAEPGVLAIPLSFVNPRAGRTNNLFALLAYMIYSNLLSVSQAWVAQGRLAFEIGVWAVHVGMFLLAHRALLSTTESPGVGQTPVALKIYERHSGARDIRIHGLGATGIPDAFCIFRPDPRA
jgi:hypothetical protein